MSTCPPFWYRVLWCPSSTIYPFCLSYTFLLLFFLNFFFSFLFLPLLTRSNIGERRTRGKKKKIKELGSCLEKDRKEEDGEEAHSVRETGCGQLFTSWRMIPCGVPLQNASSRGSTGEEFSGNSLLPDIL